ncbi:MAG TPA: VOC family protein [Candidatus Acidoferrales bacterium]|nr:VOC family protein [Candidatus Acidoferrales bacterium]
MITGIDHVVRVVSDLDRAVAEHEARGFTVTPGGEHAGGLTHNALVGFADGSYLELIAFHDAAAARGQHSWQPVAERGGGWADFALGSDDLAADAAALSDLLKRPPESGGRTRPDGVAVAWQSARLVAPLPFLIEDITLRQVRVPSGAQATHANGTRGIAGIVLGTRDVAGTTARYARLRERRAPPIEIVPADEDRLRDVRFRVEPRRA